MNERTFVFSSELFDRSGFKDPVFEGYVQRWMAEYMPSFPLGLLRQETEFWWMTPDKWHEVRKVTNPDGEIVWVVVNTNTNDYLPENRHSDDGIEIEGETVGCWFDECDARDKAEEADGKVEMEYIPWMHNRAFQPDRSVTDEMLQGAGFRVAEYSPSGRWHRGDSYRLSGINGVGYNHVLAHWAPLVVAWHQAKDVTVPTSQGDKEVTDYERDLLGALADVEIE